MVLSYKSLSSHICKAGILTDFSDGSEERAAVRCLELSGLSWNPFTITGSAFMGSELVRAGEDQAELQLNIYFLQPPGLLSYG